MTDVDVEASRKQLYRSALAWMEKRRPQDWRKPKKKRVKAFMVIKAWNNAVRRCLPLQGLRHFRVPASPTDGPPRALHWPAATLTADFGSDILAAMNFLQRDARVRLNVEFFPGMNHASWGAVKAAWKAAGLWRHMLVMVVHFLCRHGPPTPVTASARAARRWTS